MKPVKAGKSSLPDASANPAINGIRVLSQPLADRLKVPVGEVVAWAVVFPRP